MTIHEELRTIRTQIEHKQDIIQQNLSSIRVCRKRIAELRQQIKELKEKRRRIILSSVGVET